MGIKVDITGKKFNSLTAIKESGRSKYGQITWECICDCGNTVIAWSANIRNGHTKSCGCAKGTHKMSDAGVYKSWRGMMGRCTKNFYAAKFYHDKGITVCEPWKKFENFYADMGDRPEGMSIDRIDGEKGYEPGNCRWADSHTQAQNQSSTKLTKDGVLNIRASCASGITQKEMALKYCINQSTVSNIVSRRRWSNI